MSKMLTELFTAEAKKLSEAYQGTSLSGEGNAKNRTCSNREYLVAEFLGKVLPKEG